MAATLDISNAGTLTGYPELRKTTGDQKLSQLITVTQGGQVVKVVLRIWKNGTPTGNVWAEIWSDSSGSPGAKLGGNSATIDISTLSAVGGEEKEFAWSSNEPLITASTSYHIVFNGDNTIDGANYGLWYNNNNASFSNGKKYDGANWNAIADTKFIFEEYWDIADSGNFLTLL